MNPLARYGRHHLPRCATGGRRGHECDCPFMASCATCGGVGFCYCLARYEDEAREQAEEHDRKEQWDAWTAYQQSLGWQERDEDEALDHERAYGHERRQQMADSDRRD